MRSVLVAAMGRRNGIVRTIDAVPEEADTAHSRWVAAFPEAARRERA